MAVPLHNHTQYSALDGLATPKQIADRCTSLGFEAVGCTDHNLVSGHVDFFKEVDKAGIKPILGIETYQTVGSMRANHGHRRDPNTGEKSDNFHLILLAMNETGLKNLYSLVTEAHSFGHYYVARCDWDLLEQYNEGLICTSACSLGLVQQSLNNNSWAGDPDALVQRYLDIFGDRFYLELSTYPESWQHTLNVSTWALAQNYGVPVVYANDAHYASLDQYPLHEITLCMNPPIKKLSELKEPHHKPALYIMSEDEARDHLVTHLGINAVEEAIQNSHAIANLTNVRLPEHKKHIPIFIPEGYPSSKEMIFDLVEKGYDEKVVARNLSDEVYLPRLQSEMEVIFNADLVDYLLMVRDFIVFAQEQDYLVGPGRGSVGGSLVAYLLGITQVDPIHYGLIFERFYNAGREASLPDIDVDFPTYGRDEVKSYLVSKYGKEYVADIGNVLRMQGKAAIQKLGVVMEINKTDTNKISKQIDSAIESGLQPTWEMIYDKVGTELEPFKNRYPDLFEYAEALQQHPFSWGVHASGVLISDEPLKEAFPLRYHAKDKKLVTQWDMRVAEELGFMKVDLLGLRNLDTLEEVNMILKETGREPIVYDESLQYMNHPDEMWEMLERGLTIGLFQIQDGGTAKRLASSIKPRSVEDLALITALNRPGVLISGADKRYISARNGQRGNSIDPIVDKVCEETHGEFVYQEQVIRFFQEVGYPLIEADEVRAMMGKKKREKMKAEFPRYLSRAKKLMSEQTAEKIWSILENFSKYGFNKVHSIEYGIILLWTLYAKWRYPKEFILAGLRTVDKKDRWMWIEEAKRMGIPILPPTLNRSKANATIDGIGIRYGYADAKGVGQGPAKWLEKNGPFVDWDHVFDFSQEDENKYLLPNGTLRVAITRKQIEILQQFEELQGEDLIVHEEAVLGVALSDQSATILDKYKNEIEEDCTALDLLEDPGEYNVVGVIRGIKQTKTKTGNPMAWITLEHEGIQEDFAVWNKELRRLQFVWKHRTAVLAQIKVNDTGLKSIQAAKILY